MSNQARETRGTAGELDFQKGPPEPRPPPPAACAHPARPRRRHRRPGPASASSSAGGPRWVWYQLGCTPRPAPAHELISSPRDGRMTRVPSTAASGTARPWQPDGSLLTHRLQGPVQVRCKTRKAFEHSRYMRVTALVNLRRSTRRAGKFEQMSRALALVALTHLRYMHSEHPFMLELASSPPVKLPCSPPRTIRAFGRLVGRWWLLELIGQRQRRQHFGTLETISGLLAVGVGSDRAHAEAPEHRLCCSAVQALVAAARGPTSSGPHAGCTLGACMLGGLILA